MTFRSVLNPPDCFKKVFQSRASVRKVRCLTLTVKCVGWMLDATPGLEDPSKAGLFSKV